MKLAVTGSRHWTDSMAIRRELDAIDPRPTVLIHGGAQGADTYAELWARERRIPCAIVRPVEPTSRPSYLERNGTIVDLADLVIVFRAEGKSNGTDDCTAKAIAAGKLLKVVCDSRMQ